eukprot:13327918-Ditylum_brightwellii.AAC.1
MMGFIVMETLMMTVSGRNTGKASLLCPARDTPCPQARWADDSSFFGRDSGRHCDKEAELRVIHHFFCCGPSVEKGSAFI